MIPHWEFQEALGAPDAPGVQNGTVWTRTFGGGATKVMLQTASAPKAACAPDAMGAWSIENTEQFFALVASNASTRVYNLSCTTKCSTSWHTATAVMHAPFAALHIDFHMQPGFHPVSDDGDFDESCSIIQWRGSSWCAAAENPACRPAGGKTSCIEWASGRTTGCGAAAGR